MKPATLKPNISKSVLDQIDIRIGTIVSALSVPNSSKLVSLIVDFGDHKRTILSGKQQERPDLSVLQGKQALFVVNLEPRKLAGIQSEGMLFDIGYEDGILHALAMPERAVPNGSRVGQHRRATHVIGALKEILARPVENW